MVIIFLCVAASFLLSLCGKLLADNFLTERVAVVGSFAGLQYATNKGVAFSITFPGHLQTVFIAIALIAIIWASTKAKTTMSKVAFGLIVGGALGNVADRALDGVVTDFFQVGTFPIVNVADSFITIGVSLLLFEAAWVWYKR